MESELNAKDLGKVAEALVGGLNASGAVNRECASNALLQDMVTKTVVEVDETFEVTSPAPSPPPPIRKNVGFRDFCWVLFQ